MLVANVPLLKAQPAPGLSPPALGDPTQYVCRPGVPILPAHEAARDPAPDGSPRPPVVDDEARLQLICRNARKRAELGDLPLLYLGHSDPDKTELEQPPLAGYASNLRVGLFDGRPTIYVDFYVKSEFKDVAGDFPRRSVEAMYSDESEDRNFVDSIALLRRMPHFAMGLVSRYARKPEPEMIRARYEMAASPPIRGEEPSRRIDIKALDRFARENGLYGLAPGRIVARYRAERAAGRIR